MSNTQIKLFRAEGGKGIGCIEAVANDWLRAEPEGTEILSIHTALSECAVGGESIPIFVLTIWYCPSVQA